MKYKTIFARSFSKEEQKKLGWGAFVGCLMVVISFCMIFKPYLLGPLTVPNLLSSTGMSSRLSSMVNDTTAPRIEKIKSTESNETALPKNGPQNVLTTAAIETTTQGKPTVGVKTTQSNHIALPKDGQKHSPPKDGQGTTLPTGEVETNRSIASPKEGQEIALPKTVWKTAPPTDDTEKPQRPDAAPPKEGNEIALPKKIKENAQPICRTLEPRSDYCTISGDVRIHGKNSTIFVATQSQSITGMSEANYGSSWTIKPYARKGDQTAMKDVTELSVRMAKDLPCCTINHSIPAVVFSLGGYSGNHFHDFTDIIIPLYAASRQFDGEVQFLVTNENLWWTNKFKAIIEKLSKYEVISIDGDEQIHCFRRMIIGLYKNHRELSIDSSKSPHSMKEFKEFLRSSYSLNKINAIKLGGTGRGGSNQRWPRLLIISRTRTRTFTNIPKIASMARHLGFEVFVEEATRNVSSFARTVNSCDVMMGVHGAGLTNMMFLPDNAVLIQAVPLGMGWLARYDFGEPAADMNIRYLEYKIKEKESTLVQQYPHDHPVFRNPQSIQKLGWAAFRSVYLDKQNVKLDVRSFRATLSEALDLLH